MIGFIRKHHQTITAISAIVVSVIALFVAWDQARVMRAQQHSDVWPAVQIQAQFATQADGYVMLFDVKNDGIGPAIVEHVSASLGGVELGNWEQLGRSVPDGLEIPGMWTGALRGEILAPGEEAVLSQMTWPREGTDPALMRQFRSELWEVEIEICNCSVYGRCWLVDNDRTEIRPQAVPQCPAADPESNL